MPDFQNVELTRTTPPTGVCIPLNLTNDDNFEGNESYSLSLSNNGDAAVITSMQNTTQILIMDDDGK